MEEHLQRHVVDLTIQVGPLQDSMLQGHVLTCQWDVISLSIYEGRIFFTQERTFWRSFIKEGNNSTEMSYTLTQNLLSEFKSEEHRLKFLGTG